MKGVITITTTINRSLYDKCHNEKGELTIKWSEAIRRGITSILSERGDEQYLNPLQLQRKITALVDRLEELSQENEKLRKVQK